MNMEDQLNSLKTAYEYLATSFELLEQEAKRLRDENVLLSLKLLSFGKREKILSDEEMQTGA